MNYNYTQADLFSATEHKKTGAGTPVNSNSSERTHFYSGVKNKLSQELKETKNFGKKMLTGFVLAFCLFSLTNLAGGTDDTQAPILGARAEDTAKQQANPLTLVNEDGKGVEVTPQVIAELKAESVKSMTQQQKKEALKILLAEADENAILEALK